MADNNNFTPRPMLIFIPDISGFSKFVNETDVVHSQHIIEELLEILIDANEMNLQLSEIEGDAILFYKSESADSMKDLMDQVQSMYTNFHSHLKKYEHDRICQCGACTTANMLKLKFVIAFGDVGFSKIKNHSKLFGKEVIVAHRLLKNSVTPDEYVLITDEALNKYSVQDQPIGNIEFKRSRETYDIGEIDYHFASLQPFFESIPQPTIESYGLNDSKTQVLKSEVTIEGPIDLVFNVVSDYSIRHLWQVGLKGSDKLNGKIYKNGSTHRCLINNKDNDPFFIAHDFKIDNDRIVFSETDHEQKIGVVYELQKIDSQSTLLTVHTFLEANILKRVVFSLLFKNKIAKSSQESFQNLSVYCQKILNSEQELESQVVLAKIG
jgi:hypothetical protein